MPYTPGDEIAQGAPADIGGLNPIAAIIKYLTQIMGPQVPPQVPAPQQWAVNGAPTDPGGSAYPQPPLKGRMTQGR